jgi:phage terminase small subunit
MPKKRSPERDKAFDIYKEHKGEIQLREIGKLLNTPEKTISGWKVKDRWDEVLNGVLQLNTEYSKQKKLSSKQEKKEAKLKGVIEADSSELNDKQNLFCTYYVKYRNKTKAYMKAYQCSWENANAHAYELWYNVGVKNEIDRQLKELRDTIKLDAQDIVQRYTDIAFADITDYVEFGQEEVPVMGPFGPIVIKKKGHPDVELKKVVNVVRFKESAEIDGTIISEVKQGRDGASIKLQDKMKALDWLANHMDLLDTATKEKLKIAQNKLELEKRKVDGDDDEGAADDGFIEALQGKVKEVWDDED